MLETLAIVLLALWVLGLVRSLGPAVHILLILALVVLAVRGHLRSKAQSMLMTRSSIARSFMNLLPTCSGCSTKKKRSNDDSAVALTTAPASFTKSRSALTC